MNYEVFCRTLHHNFKDSDIAIEINNISQEAEGRLELVSFSTVVKSFQDGHVTLTSIWLSK